MTLAAFQVRVEAVIDALERLHDRQYPLRRIPMDLVAEAVATEVHPADLEALSPRQIADTLNVILARNAALPTAVRFATGPDAFEVASPWQASSFLPHDGVERLRDGG